MRRAAPDVPADGSRMAAGWAIDVDLAVRAAATLMCPAMDDLMSGGDRVSPTALSLASWPPHDGDPEPNAVVCRRWAITQRDGRRETR